MLPRSDNGVVDPWLSVYGTQNVRVVDMSISPIHVASHTQSVACESASLSLSPASSVTVTDLDYLDSLF